MQINLFLRILKRRPDGYHDLASLFHVSSMILLLQRLSNLLQDLLRLLRCRLYLSGMQRGIHPSAICIDSFYNPVSMLQVIDLGDSMHFEVLPRAERDELSCDAVDVPTDDSNLVLRVRLFFLWMQNFTVFVSIPSALQISLSCSLL